MNPLQECPADSGSAEAFARAHAPGRGGKHGHCLKEVVGIPAGDVVLPGDLEVPPNAQGIILFAHGAGSNRHSPSDQCLAEMIRTEGFGTLLLDLWTLEDDKYGSSGSVRHLDPELFARRLVTATQWLVKFPETRMLKPGYFGAGVGSAAALIAAAELGDQVAAVVSRGGAVDLAVPALPRVRAPTLLIVGGHDSLLVSMNHEALPMMRCERQLRMVMGATHLFPEPGVLEKAGFMAADWFVRHMAGGSRGLAS